MRTRGIIPSVDGARAIAALMVLFYHARFPGVGGGFIGVDIFFVLSAYLITNKVLELSEKPGGFRYGQFMQRRMLRLYPALLVVLLAFGISAPWLFPTADLWNELVLSGLYLTDYSRAFYQVPDYLRHTWSLSVEMQFYLIWPFVVLALAKIKRPEYGCWALLALFVVVVCWRASTYKDGMGWYHRLDTRASALILGSAIAFYVAPQIKRSANAIGIVCLVALFIGALSLKIKSFDYASWGGGLVELCAAGLLIAAITPGTTISRVLGHPVLATVGLWSYSIYLWHYPISRLTRVEFDGITSTAITLAATLPLAAATYYLVEMRFYRRQGDSTAPTSTTRPQEA